uniref:Uncharacterized protein n=1 Tax=Arundo donax TaxID=35708 RepID=A0A0A9FTD8_ARUDO
MVESRLLLLRLPFSMIRFTM